MKTKQNLFLDYGGLIFNYDFNRETLQRAHKLALSYINSLDGREVSTQALETAHNKAIETYLWARKQDNSEWTMNQIMGLMVSNLGITADVPHLEDIYKFNDHNSTPYPHSRKVLAGLAEKYKLGIISNLPHDSLITELEREKVVQGYKPLVNVGKLGFLWHVMFLRLKTSTEEQREEMTDYLKKIPEIFYVVRGVGNCNLMVEFQTKTLDEFEKVKEKVSVRFSNMIADEKTVQLTEEHKCTYFPGSFNSD